MSYCSKCGAQLLNQAVICVNCGCPTPYGSYLHIEDHLSPAPNRAPTLPPKNLTRKRSGTETAALIFMFIAGLIWVLDFLLLTILGFFPYSFITYIPLCWCIPMVDHYSKKTKRGECVSVGFKICSLLFVSFFAGILMLCDSE